MKRLLIALLLALTLAAPAFAANSATEIATAQRKDCSTHQVWTVRQIKVVRDTAADITVRTPASGKSVALVGISVLDATAATLTIKSASTTLVQYEFTTNQGMVSGVGQPLLFTAEDAALVVGFSANVDTAVFHVVDFEDQLPCLF